MTKNDYISKVLAEFEKLWMVEFGDMAGYRHEYPAIEDFLSSKLSEAIQDFIRATEVEEKPEISVVETEEIYAEGWNAAISAQKEKIKHYLGNG